MGDRSRLMQAQDTHDNHGVPIPAEPTRVPGELRALRRWACWRGAWKPCGRIDKPPINVRTRQFASSTDPSTWSTFDDAVAALERDRSLWGLSFALTSDDDLVGIDLDDCVDEHGNIAPEAQAVIDEFDTYAEVSPSGTGVKVFLRGCKPEGSRCRKLDVFGCKEIEIYEHARFFAVTGAHVEGTPVAIEERQGQLETLCGRLWPPEAKSTRNAKPTSGGFEGSDRELLEKMFAAENGDAVERLFGGDISAYGDDHSRADIALCTHLAFWTNGNFERIDMLFRMSKLFRKKWERHDYRRSTITRAIQHCSAGYTPTGAERMKTRPSSKPDKRPVIQIITDEHRVVAEAITALIRDAGIFRRGSMLVRIVRNVDPQDGVNRSAGSPVIQRLPPANLRERLTMHARFQKRSKKGRLMPAHPPAWLVAEIDHRGEFPGIRPLRAISEIPILRPDGSICQTAGYDETTGVLYEPSCVFPIIDPHVDLDDADQAVNYLRAVVCDFRFNSPEHFAAWLAGFLTVLARFAFMGPAPLFLIDANVRGAGKTLLVLVIGRIILGRDIPVSSYTKDVEEMRKKITSLALAGDATVLLDNLAGTFCNDALNRALTSTRWNDRLLGGNESVDLPLSIVWFATGNNVSIAGDTARRIIPIRLDVLDERPEERTGFRHPKLLEWVTEQRASLLVAGLSILAAYFNAGCPKQDLTPFGSFEGWSDIVRQAVVFAGLPDPCATRMNLQDSVNHEADAIGQFISALQAYDVQNIGVYVSELLGDLYPTQLSMSPNDVASVVMRRAIEILVGCPLGKPPSPKQLGRKLSAIKRCVNDGFYLDADPSAPKRHGVRWRVFQVKEGA